MDLQKEDPKEFIMATFEFIETLVSIMVHPIIGWVIIEVVNIPTYIEMVKQFKQRQEQEEMMEISLIVADFHRSIGK